MTVHKLTVTDEIRLWWTLSGELQADVITYYAVCCVVGYLQGWYLGNLIVGMWG